MDGYYRNGELIDHKVKADEAVARAKEQGFEVDKVLVWRRHHGQYASASPMVEGRDVFVDEPPDRLHRGCGRPGVDAGRGAAVPDIRQRHDRPAQGLPTQHRRLSRLLAVTRTMSVGHDWAFERELLQALPAEPFDTALTVTPRVDRYAQLMVRCNQYSVPARFIGHRLRVKLSASTVTVFDRNTVVARHQRAIGKGVKVLNLDHYLEILLRKPGALPGATALAQARAAGAFTSEHEAFWAAARMALGDSAGTRTLIEVLLLHRHLEHADVLAGITAARTVGSVSADVVAVEARKAAQRRGVQPPPVEATPRRQQVVSLTERRLVELPGDDRPLPSVDAYDDLLGKASS
jgi:hypothetical protein